MASARLVELLDELERKLGAGPSSARDLLLDRITAFFLVDADRLREDHVALFDEVIHHLAQGSGLPSRIQLSERMADVVNAPLKVVNALARDEIAVARPVLQRSPRLTDETLVQIVSEMGADHILAITERRNLDARITDALVAGGDRLVLNALVSNHSARFSDLAFAELIDRAARDELLQFTLTQRGDIPRMHLGRLLELAKETAHRRMAQTLARVKARAPTPNMHTEGTKPGAHAPGSHAPGAQVPGVPGPGMPALLNGKPVANMPNVGRDYAAAIAEISDLAQRDALDEPALGTFARNRKFEHVICALAYMARVPVNVAERVLEAPDHDLILVAARSIDLEWGTVAALLRLRSDTPRSRHSTAQLQETYHKLTKTTAQRVLRFIQARESAGNRQAQPVSSAS